MTRGLFLRRGWTLPLFLSLFVDNLRGTPLRAAALLAAFFWAAAALKAAGRRPAFPPALLLFLAWCAAGAVFSLYRAGTLAELCLLAGAVALWAGAVALRATHPEEASFFPRAILALGLLKAATSLLFPAPGGAAWNPGDLGTANTSLTPMFLVLCLIVGMREKDTLWRGLWALLLAATVWLCISWNAMAALLGLGLGLPLAEAFRRGSRGFFWGAAAGAGALLVLFFTPAAPKWIRYNADNPARFERIAIWRDSLTYAGDHLWTGTALGTYEQYYPQYKTLPSLKTANHAHNDWLQLLCETGLPGAVLVLILLAGFFSPPPLWGRVGRGGGLPPAAATGLVLLGLWACLYFPFRSDPLLFMGGFLIAALPGGTPVPLTRRAGAALLAAATLLSVVVLSQGTAQGLERWGGAAWDAGSPAAALDRFRWASRLDPWEPRYLMHQVECLRALDRKPETLPLLEKAAALKPRDVWIRRKWAVARLHLVGPEAAQATYAPILTLAPNVEQFRQEYDDLASPKR